MAQSGPEVSTAEQEMIRVELELTHPDCWSEQVTAECDAGLLGHGVYTGDDGVAKGRFTVYSDTLDEVERLIQMARESQLTGPIMEIKKSLEVSGPVSASPGNATREIFVTFHPDNALDELFFSRGFVYDGPVQIRDGVETWYLMAHKDRQEVKRVIREVEEAGHADIDIKSITSKHQPSGNHETNLQQLSVRQREIFEFARNNGYYQWPRGVTARELAAELGISKTTFLEHLRKAEAKLLTSL